MTSNIPTTMQGLKKLTPTPGYSLVKDIPVPEPVDDEVLIKIDTVAICGSDIALYNWTSVAQVGSRRIKTFISYLLYFSFLMSSYIFIKCINNFLLDCI